MLWLDSSSEGEKISKAGSEHDGWGLREDRHSNFFICGMHKSYAKGR